MSPTKGRIVFVTLPSDGNLVTPEGEFAAVVTNVHGEDCINALVFSDGPQGVLFFSSIMRNGKQGDGYTGPIWDWPPRAHEPKQVPENPATVAASVDNAGGGAGDVSGADPKVTESKAKSPASGKSRRSAAAGDGSASGEKAAG